MKNHFYFIFMLLSVFPATKGFASLVCSNMAGDAGYRVKFSQNGLSAEVEENNLAGARLVAKVTCEKVEEAPCCDQMTTTHCVDDDSSRDATDSTYAVTLNTGGFAGISKVKLYHGRREVAEIVCRNDK